MAADDHAVTVLNALTEAALDSADGYRTAAEAVESPRFRSLFDDLARKRERLTAELKAEVRSFGAEPADDISMLGATHRAFLDLKERVTGKDDAAVIAEVERCEDVIRRKFETAVADARLAPAARPAIERAYAAVQADHDEISALRRAVG